MSVRLSVDYSYSRLLGMKFLRHETNQLSVRLAICGRGADSNLEALAYRPGLFYLRWTLAECCSPSIRHLAPIYST